MYLNAIGSAHGFQKKSKRVGRGIGSTFGKTCGRGHKGQKSRSGGFHKVGFEGGQMPLQRRLPKVGFRSRIKKYSSEVTLHEVSSLKTDSIDLVGLKNANLVPKFTKTVKVIKSGKILKSITIKGLKVTVGAKSSIESVGGKVES